MPYGKTVFTDADQVGNYVQKKVCSLQARLLADGGSQAAAKASLAKLRSSRALNGAAWMMVGEELFDGFDELELTSAGEERALNAIRAALCLYAVHQQSKSKPMAYRDKDEDSALRNGSVGASCRRVSENKRNGVFRRLGQVESSADFDGAVHVLRGIFTILNDEGKQVNYRRLAHDLCLMQDDRFAHEVFMNWSKDYFAAGNGVAAEEE